MGLLDDFNAHREGFAYIKMLQQHCLLEKGQNTLTTSEDTHVRMNPMIRKAIIKTLNGREANWYPDSSWRTSLTEKTWPAAQRVWASPKDLEMLKKKSYLDPRNEKLLQSNLQVLVSRFAIKFDHCRFDELVFLDLEGANIPNLPQRVFSMKNLEYLNVASTGIRSVPVNLRDLSRLKYLTLRRNPSLENIPTGVIVRMKELKLLDLFDTGCFLSTALINEVKEAEIDNFLAGFTVGNENVLSELRELPQVCPLYMCLSGFQVKKVDLLHMLADFDRLYELQIKSSNKVRSIVYTDLVVQNTPKIFACLRKFEINNLQNLETVDLQPEGLSIKSVTVCGCSKLTDLTWIISLVNLEELIVKDCCSIRTLVSSRETQEVGLPKLKKVELHDLPEFRTLSEASLSLESITHYCVFQCCKLSGLPKLDPEERVLLDCDEDFWNIILQAGMATQYPQRARH